jgi:hypothetical protein
VSDPIRVEQDAEHDPNTLRVFVGDRLILSLEADDWDGYELTVSDDVGVWHLYCNQCETVCISPGPS